MVYELIKQQNYCTVYCIDNYHIVFMLKYIIPFIM